MPETIKAFFIPQLKYLDANGFDVTVICSQCDTLQNEIGGKVHYEPLNIPRGLSLLGSLKAIQALYKLFKKERFDLVQYSTPNAALYASIASKMVGIKIRIYHLMGFRYLGSNGIERIFLKEIEKIVCELSTSIECVSQSNLKLGIEEHLLDMRKSTVIWNGSTGGVDLKRFDFSKRKQWREEIRKKLGYSADDFVFGFVGRITRDKGINEILNAYQIVSNKAKLLLIGNIENEDTLDTKLFLNAKKDPNIIFLGSVADIERYYTAIDILLLPSYREGFGNVIVEAAAVGTPAIISNIPGPIDAIEEGKTAKVISVKNVKELSEAMQQCIEQGKFNTKTCAEFVESHFDSEKLCEYILRQKKLYFIDQSQ